MKTTEYQEQKALIQWANLHLKKYPCLEYLHASLNGIHTTPSQAMMAKMSGLKSGVPDLFLPVKTKEFSGLFIEMKSAKGVLSPNQKKFLAYLSSQNFKCVVAYSAKEAAESIINYLA
jgi:hypothetical protein